MIKVVFIRHSKTKGNLLGRYIGTTDESLCAEGIELLKGKTYPDVQAVYCSNMIRCKETAKIIYGDIDPVEISDLRECDFGEFENKNYKELSGNENYQKWIDSNGKLPFPGGESNEEFKERCCKGFEGGIRDAIDNGYKQIAFVVHGGTIMSILERYSESGDEFYHWQVRNGEGFFCFVDEESEVISGICHIK